MALCGDDWPWLPAKWATFCLAQLAQHRVAVSDTVQEGPCAAGSTLLLSADGFNIGPLIDLMTMGLDAGG
jgi:hypothetical protein